MTTDTLTEEAMYNIAARRKDDVTDIPIEHHTAKFVWYSDKGERIEHLVSIPEGYTSDPVCLAIIKFINSYASQDFSDSASKLYHRVLQRYFGFLASQTVPLSPAPTDIGLQYLHYLRQNEDHKGAAHYGRYTRSLLNHIVEKFRSRHLKLDDDIYKQIVIISDRWPTIAKEPNKPKSSMSEMFEDCPYDDFKMLDSIRLVAMWFINEWRDIKRDFSEQYPEFIERCQGVIDQFDINEKPCLESGAFKSRNDTTKLYAEFTLNVIEFGHPLLIEAMFASQVSSQRADRKISPYYYMNTAQGRLNRRVTLDIEKTLLQRYIHDKSDFFVRFKGRSTKPNGNGNGANQVKAAEVNFGISNLFRPAEFETLMMGWFMASDRCQESNIDRLTLQDLSVSHKSCQVTDFKGRANTTYSGPLYKRNQMPYHVMVNWKNDMRTAYERGYLSSTESLDNRPLIAFRQMTGVRWIIRSRKGCTLPIVMLGMQNSQTAHYCKEAFKENGLEGKEAPFLWLLNKIIIHETEHHKQRHKYRKAESLFKAKGGTKPVRKDFVTLSEIHLFPDNIGRCHVYIRDQERGEVFESEDASLSHQAKTNDAERMRLALSHHSPKSHHDLYQARATNKTVIGKQSRFARLVGERMVEDASALLELIDTKVASTQVISLQEATGLLGLDMNHLGTTDQEKVNELLKQADLHEFVIGLTGEFTKDSVTYIVQTPINAALIKGYIKHIDDHVEELGFDNIKRCEEITVHRMYLSMVLERFPEKILQSADHQYGDIQFPYPPIIN